MEQSENIQNNNSQSFAPKKKKKRIGCFITLGIFLIILGVIFWIVGSVFFFKPKDLGVRYTEADYKSAIEKTGISITFDGKTGQTLEQYKKDSKGKKLDIKDYNWDFSDYKRETVTLTAAEASALLDNIAPSFWWFKNVQVKALPNGIMEGSSTLDLSILDDLIGEKKALIPFDVPKTSKIIIYSKGALSIKENKISASPDVFNVGPFQLSNDVLNDENISIMEEEFAKIYTIVPDLKIHSLTADANGNFVFDGTYPHSVNITPKN